MVAGDDVDLARIQHSRRQELLANARSVHKFPQMVGGRNGGDAGRLSPVVNTTPPGIPPVRRPLDAPA